jgi:hypothetical protein
MEPRDEAGTEANGESREWKVLSGSGFSRLGAPKGRRTSREDGRDEGKAVVSRTPVAVRDAVEVLEGGRKAMSDDQPEGKPTGGPDAGRRQGPSRKAKGRRRSR